MLKAFASDDGPADRPARQAFSVHAGPKPLPELLKLAAAASRSGTCLSFTDVQARPLEDLVRIAAVGGDAVSFGRDGAAAAPDEEPEPTPAPSAMGRLFSLFGRR